jgi:hypothetical protein
VAVVVVSVAEFWWTCLGISIAYMLINGDAIACAKAPPAGGAISLEEYRSIKSRVPA